VKKQVWTQPTTIAKIMRSPAFARGVAEVRAGRPPQFDAENDPLWAYERGRQWAVAAPPTMPLMIGHRLNPQAIKLFKWSAIR
jgi:hypothetical protein